VNVLLVPAHPGFPGQIPHNRKTVVVVVVVIYKSYMEYSRKKEEEKKHTMNTHTTVLWPSWILSGTTRVSRHQKGKTRKVKPVWIYWSKR